MHGSSYLFSSITRTQDFLLRLIRLLPRLSLRWLDQKLQTSEAQDTISSVAYAKPLLSRALLADSKQLTSSQSRDTSCSRICPDVGEFVQ